MLEKSRIRILTVIAIVLGIVAAVVPATAHAAPFDFKSPRIPCPHCPKVDPKPFAYNVSTSVWMPAAYDKATEYGTGFGGQVKAGFVWDSNPKAVSDVTGASPLRKTQFVSDSNFVLHVRAYVQKGVAYNSAGRTSNLWYPGCVTKINGKVMDERRPSPAAGRTIGEYTECTAYGYQAR